LDVSLRRTQDLNLAGGRVPRFYWHGTLFVELIRREIVVAASAAIANTFITLERYWLQRLRKNLAAHAHFLLTAQ
jgi:hypothetical protein